MARSSGSSSGGSESKTPLVVALVFFILATIALGILTYTGYGAANTEREIATKANADKTQMQNERDKANDIASLYRVAIGTADATQRSQVESSRFGNELAAEQTAFMNALTKRHGDALTNVKNDIGLRAEFVLNPGDYFKWAATESGGKITAPPIPLIDATIKALGERQLAQNKANATEKNFKELQELAQKTLDSYAAATKSFIDIAQQFPNKIAENAAKYEAANKQITDKFTADMDNARKEIQKKENEIFNVKEDLNKSNQTVGNLTKRVEKVESEQEQQANPFSYDKPAGSIIRRQINSKQVEINLGSADLLKPGVKFSVQPSDTKEVGLGSRLKSERDANGKTIYRIKSKANIEVVEILGPHLSVARITEEFDEVRDRVMAGDLLYNSAWRKGSADHIALMGIFDLDADGIDDIQFVIKNLNTSGIVVDAYFDLASGKWVGKVTERTIYAIEGYMPVLKGLDGNADAKARIISQVEEAKKYCQERGAKVVKIRDFFPRIGYDVNLGITDDRINQASAKYFTAQPAAGEAPMGGEKKDN